MHQQKHVYVISILQYFLLLSVGSLILIGSTDTMEL